MEKAGPYATDQTACYDESGALVACAGTGQDGETRAGRSWPAPRFAVSGGVAKDLLTGLSWPLDANPAEFALCFDEALDFIGEANREAFLGFSDWRLPKRSELFSLASHVNINPCLPEGHPFENVFSGYCWTSAVLSRLPDQAFTLHLGGARSFPAMKQASCLVWPVRGPELAEEMPGGRRFRVRGNWVLDLLTGLWWEKSPSGLLLTWEGALARAREARGPEGRAPRLANVRELFSLVSVRDHEPAIAKGHPFEKAPEFCWTSTTSAVDPSYAWTGYLRDGRIGVGEKRQAGFAAWLCA